MLLDIISRQFLWYRSADSQTYYQPSPYANSFESFWSIYLGVNIFIYIPDFCGVNNEPCKAIVNCIHLIMQLLMSLIRARIVLYFIKC